jgi:hypothetical protein
MRKLERSEAHAQEQGETKKSFQYLHEAPLFYWQT